MSFSNKNTSALIAFSVKLAIAIGLLGYLVNKVDIAPVFAQIHSMQLEYAVVAVFAMLLQLMLVSFRWQLVNGLVGANMRTAQVFRLTLIGQFFNQVLPSAVGGDAVRAWLASREGVPIGRAVTAILCDRAVGLVVLVLVISCTFFILPTVAPNKLPASSGLRIVALLGLSGLATLFFLGDALSRMLMRSRITAPIGKLVRDLRSVLYSHGLSISIMGLAAAVQVVIVTAIYICAKGMNIQLAFSSALLVIPSIMLVSMIPISFAGWGVREGAMIFGLGVVGIAATDALAVSIAFGLLQIVIGLPGGALWLAGRRTAASAAAPEASDASVLTRVEYTDRDLTSRELHVSGSKLER